MKSVSFVAAGMLVCALGAATPAQAVDAPAQGGETSHGRVQPGSAFVAASVPDIRARIRKANATKMSARDRQCRSFISARMPKWWGPSGHTVVCKAGKIGGKYDFWFDGVAVLTVNSNLDAAGWAQAVAWAPSKVAATERQPLSAAPALCRKAIAGYARLSRQVGYRVRCVPTISWKVPDKTLKDASVLGFIQYGKKDIAILETRDVKSMSFVTAHELGHAVSFMPKAAGLRTEMTRHAKRRTFTGGAYVGMPAEIWAESFARYWTGQNIASIQPNRLSVARTAAMLKKYGLPRR